MCSIAPSGGRRGRRRSIHRVRLPSRPSISGPPPRTSRPLRETGWCWWSIRRRSSSARCCCSRCSRCSPRWCCRGSAARRRCGRWRWCSSSRCCSAGYAYAHFLMQIKNRVDSGRGASGAAGDCDATLPLSIASGWGEPPTPAMRSGCSACLPSRSACRSSRSPPTIRCCRPGSCAPAIPPAPIRTSSMLPPISAASSRCCPIRCCWSRCSRCTRRT